MRTKSAKTGQMQEAEKRTGESSRFFGFSWSKLIYTLIIILLYVPTVFVGVQTFLPEYSDYEQGVPYKDCYLYTNLYNTQQQECRSEEEVHKAVELQQQCVDEQQNEINVYKKAKREYDTWKYLSVLSMAVLTLILVMVLGFDVPIKIGLFVGAAAAVFIATIQYFETKSIPAFIVLLAVFCIIVYVIQKRERFFG